MSLYDDQLILEKVCELDLSLRSWIERLFLRPVKQIKTKQYKNISSESKFCLCYRIMVRDTGIIFVNGVIIKKHWSWEIFGIWSRKYVMNNKEDI